MTTTRKVDIMLTEENLETVSGGGLKFLTGSLDGNAPIAKAIVEFFKDSSIMPWNWKKHTTIEDEVKNRVMW